eukprot:4543940-Amphidinium_carterae.1
MLSSGDSGEDNCTERLVHFAGLDDIEGDSIDKGGPWPMLHRCQGTISNYFIPSQAESDNTSYIWWMWLSRPQHTQYATDGTIPEYKETRGDTVHKHHRVHKAPDSCINLHIHSRWNTQSARNIYNATTPAFLLVWKSIMGRTFSSIYYRRAEDISIEFNPTFNGQRANDQ